MLEHVPEWLGHALRNVRAGASKLTAAQPRLGNAIRSIELASPAFAEGARLPVRFTADGAGVSPPLVWRGVPEGARCLALIVEDPDAPAPQPLVHALVWGLPAEDGGLSEGAIVPDGPGDRDGVDVGRNSYFREGWLPPDPPTGHGPHRYVFQLFALADPADPGVNPRRAAALDAMQGEVLAIGVLSGVYSRGEPAEVGPVGVPAR